jgi:hypothetical protein
MDVDNFEMQHIQFKSSESWTKKFVELEETLEGNCIGNISCHPQLLDIPA